jgi:hypothetical protein
MPVWAFSLAKEFTQLETASMMSSRMIAACCAVGAILLGFACDRVVQAGPTTTYCSTSTTTGCPDLDCTWLGNAQDCPDGNGFFYYAEAIGYSYTPCGAASGTKCPTQMADVCLSSGYLPNATDDCGTLICDQWNTAVSC